MSLVTCPDCGNEISNRAPACPKCGRPITHARPRPDTTMGRNRGCADLLVIAVIAVPIFFLLFFRGCQTLFK